MTENILSAFYVAGGIQVNRLIDTDKMDCQMVYPGELGWAAAQAVAGYYDGPQERPPPTIENLREQAKLSRAEFLLRCVAKGILTEDEALSAASGEIPASFAPLIDDWEPAERFEAKLRWKALNEVDRNYPLIVSLAQEKGIPEVILDEMFGLIDPVE